METGVTMDIPLMLDHIAQLVKQKVKLASAKAQPDWEIRIWNTADMARNLRIVWGECFPVICTSL